MTDERLHFHQACFYPIESLDKLREFISGIKTYFVWEHVGLLTDERVKNQIYILYSHEFQASLRLNLTDEDIKDALTLMGCGDSLEIRHLQGRKLSQDEYGTIEPLLKIWDSCVGQSIVLPVNDIFEYISRNIEQRFKKGRGKDFTQSTINQVMRDSHCYCMFEGCGDKLDIDNLTGESGNYSYLAHNVASSESGPRGIPYLSEELSNEPANILLLCDKHHRLIDRIACADYPASRLSQMRTEFSINIEKLLEGLSFQPIPVFSVLWPVGGHVVSPPESKDIAGSLSKLRTRIRGSLNNLSDNERRYRTKPERFAKEMDEIVTEEAETIINQTKNYGYRAALFAFGPMPALVGLGASLGNKSEITPMLRYRDGNCWVWPQDSRCDKPYEVNWKNEIGQSSEVTISIALTQFPEAMKNTATALGYPEIEIVAKQMGNAAIPHPENGLELKSELHAILQKLHDQYTVKRVHLLICASNAACVFVGQAFDLYHPALLIYDFDSDEMRAKLFVEHVKGKVTLSIP
jgi:hypothetical protein